MSTATLTPAAGDFHGDLSAFLAAVPAARDFDLGELFDGTPAREHRPARGEADRKAIEQSIRGDV